MVIFHSYGRIHGWVPHPRAIQGHPGPKAAEVSSSGMMTCSARSCLPAGCRCRGGVHGESATFGARKAKKDRKGWDFWDLNLEFL